MAAIKISLVADVRQFISSFKKGKESVEDVADELEDLAREGDQTERSFSENFKAIARDADKAGTKVKSSLKDGFDDAAKEAKQSGAEAAQSFSGGFDDVTDFVQETLAQGLSGFGPLGTAAGIALAVGIGAGLSALEAEQERINAVRDAAADLASTLYENNGELPITEQVERLITLLTDERKPRGLESLIDQWADFGTNLDAIRTAAKRADIPLGDLLRTIGGVDADAAKRALERVNDQLDALYLQRSQNSHGLFPDIAPLETLRTQLQDTITLAEVTDETLGAVGAGYDSAAYTAQVEAIGQAWQNAMVDASEYITEQDGVTTFDWSAYLTDAETTLAAANEYKRQILTVPPDVKAEAERIFQDQGAKAASSYLSAYDSASVKDRSRFITAARQNGEAAGTAQGEALAKKTREKAQSEATNAPPVTVPVKPGDINWSSVTRNPPTVYIPGVIVKPGTRQPL